MRDHPEAELPDLVLGRLPRERRLEVEEHVGECDSCAAEVARLLRLREEALRQGLRHVAPERIVMLAADPALAEPAESEHLESCSACREEIAWASGLGDGEEEEPPAARRAWIGALAATVVLSLFLGTWLLMKNRGEEDLSGLVAVNPLPVRTLRDVPAPGSFEESRALGLEAYASADYQTARDRLLDALELTPEHPETLLYLGSAELLAGRAEEALAHLALCESRAPLGELRDEAAWLAAQAGLLLGRSEEALPRLEELAAGTGHRREPAAGLLRSIERP